MVELRIRYMNAHVSQFKCIPWDTIFGTLVQFFSHVPRESYEEVIKHIYLYLQGVKGNILTFQPNNSLELDLYVDADF